ncbi:MAG TPA: rhodanese-like domain-containing protein [Verrucomicrobiae bacterium]
MLAEALVVAVAGAALAFAANALSPRGLKLSRDFFGPARPSPTNAVPAPTNAVAADTNVVTVTTTNTPSPHELLAARLRDKGLTLVDSNQVVRLFHDPRCQQSLVIFVDAREDEYYKKGHIPGAYQLDYYRPENYLAALLPLCQLAEQIVVYCNGGNCEDSEFAANFLLSASVPKEKLLVYGGGLNEWVTNGLPLEIGERLSGQIQTNLVR